MQNINKKIYIIKKRIKANNLQEAIKNESKGDIYESFLEQEITKDLSPAIGFHISNDD